ncbi:MAG: hypothetical protein ACRDN0_08545 [Trebonia sp.]
MIIGVAAPATSAVNHQHQQASMTPYTPVLKDWVYFAPLFWSKVHPIIEVHPIAGDHPAEHYECTWPDRFSLDDLNATGRRGLGLTRETVA